LPNLSVHNGAAWLSQRGDGAATANPKFLFSSSSNNVGITHQIHPISGKKLGQLKFFGREKANQRPENNNKFKSRFRNRVVPLASGSSNSYSKYRTLCSRSQGFGGTTSSLPDQQPIRGWRQKRASALCKGFSWQLI
jgi:hypothetical protein